MVIDENGLSISLASRELSLLRNDFSVCQLELLSDVFDYWFVT